MEQIIPNLDALFSGVQQPKKIMKRKKGEVISIPVPVSLRNFGYSPLKEKLPRRESLKRAIRRVGLNRTLLGMDGMRGVMKRYPHAPRILHMRVQHDSLWLSQIVSKLLAREKRVSPPTLSF